MDPEILKRIDSLGEKLGVAGKYLWEALVRGCFAAGLMWGIALLIIAVVSARIVFIAFCRGRDYRIGKTHIEWSDDGQVGWYAVAVCAFLLSLGTLLGAFSNFIDAVAPDRAAIKIIFGK